MGSLITEGRKSPPLPLGKTEPERTEVAVMYRGVRRNEFGEALLAKHWNNKLQKEHPWVGDTQATSIF